MRRGPSPLLGSASPPGKAPAATPPPTELPAPVQARVEGVLRELLLRAEKGCLDVTRASHDGLTVMLNHADLRCVLVVQSPGAQTTLSPRELQIAQLIADGATNRLIASILDISLWTVSTHIRRIFAKLGVNSRAEMVAHLLGTPHRTITHGDRQSRGRVDRSAGCATVS